MRSEKAADKQLNLMPVPEKISFTSGKFRLNDAFQMTIVGSPHERLYDAATRTLRRLDERAGVFLKQGFVTPQEAPEMGAMIISCARPGVVKLHEDESYSLTISSDQIGLASETDLGAMHGLQTLLQLLAADENGYYFPAVEIADKPRFPWRGLMMDVCRHWLPIDVIKRNIDGMAAVKMNVLHLHLTEDQGFRVECKTFPKLHELGSDGNYFTYEQIREIIAYADARGVRIVPEFDMPGHATSWLVGRPELASQPGPYEIERGYGIKDPSFDPGKESTYKLLEQFFAEMAALFPDEYLHIGGDENNGKHWDKNAELQKFKAAKGLKNNNDLQTYFNKRLLEILTKCEKKMVGWDEILQEGMPKNIVIQSWQGKKALEDAAQQGYSSILSNGYYIDLIQPTSFHYKNDPLPAKSKLSDDEKKRVLGGETTMWAELVTVENIDSRIWPRTAAIAERLWSPSSVNDVGDMYRRLDVISLQLESLGLTHEKNYEMMLRRLANRRDVEPLRVLVDVLEPIKIYTRHTHRDYRSFHPFTRVVDAAQPDAKAAREFRNDVTLWLNNLADEDLRSSLKMRFSEWESNHARLLPIIKESPVLKEIESMSEDLSKTASIGLQALKAVGAGRSRGKNWFETNAKIIEKAKQPRGETELMILKGIEKLMKKVK